MRYVLDSNVALKWVLPEADDDKAIRIRDEFGQVIHEWLSPDVFPVEVAHALAKAERRGDIKQGEGRKRWPMCSPTCRPCILTCPCYREHSP
jgi:predicted nucleic acid-binding protein